MVRWNVSIPEGELLGRLGSLYASRARRGWELSFFTLARGGPLVTGYLEVKPAQVTLDFRINHYRLWAPLFWIFLLSGWILSQTQGGDPMVLVTVWIVPVSLWTLLQLLIIPSEKKRLADAVQRALAQ